MSDLKGDLNRCADIIQKVRSEKSVLDFKLSQVQISIRDIEKEQLEKEHLVEVMKMASITLQQLVDKVSEQNISKIEQLVNSALAYIFFDMSLEFKITSSVKRNINNYSLRIIEDGNEGTKESGGGGITAVIAFVLKVLCNVLYKEYPFVGLDESVSFLSAKYVGTASSFIKELSNRFGLTLVMVTHNDPLKGSSDISYYIDKVLGKAVITKTENK